MNERRESGKAIAPKRWSEALKNGLELETSTIEFFESAIYKNPNTGLEFRVLGVNEGFGLMGLPPGLYADTNITLDIFESFPDVISALQRKVGMIIAANSPKPDVGMDAPADIQRALPGAKFIDFKNAFRITPFAVDSQYGRVLFEIAPVMLNEASAQIEWGLEAGAYRINVGEDPDLQILS